LPAADVLFPVSAFLFELFGSGCLVYDVASLLFGNIMPRLAYIVKMGLNLRLLKFYRPYIPVLPTPNRN
jgi:hypothetical protein